VGIYLGDMGDLARYLTYISRDAQGDICHATVISDLTHFLEGLAHCFFCRPPDLDRFVDTWITLSHHIPRLLVFLPDLYRNESSIC